MVIYRKHKACDTDGLVVLFWCWQQQGWGRVCEVDLGLWLYMITRPDKQWENGNMKTLANKRVIHWSQAKYGFKTMSHTEHMHTMVKRYWYAKAICQGFHLAVFDYPLSSVWAPILNYLKGLSDWMVFTKNSKLDTGFIIQLWMRHWFMERLFIISSTIPESTYCMWKRYIYMICS